MAKPIHIIRIVKHSVFYPMWTRMFTSELESHYLSPWFQNTSENLGILHSGATYAQTKGLISDMATGAYSFVCLSSVVILLYLVVLTNSVKDWKEKDVRDYSDADLERLLEQWEVCNYIYLA